MSASSNRRNKPFSVKRNLLKDQIANLLRENILMGKIPQGTRMVERDIANILKVSSIPVRDALLLLESEGLVESIPSGRQVIILKEKDIIQLNTVRTALEKLAVKLFIQNSKPRNIETLEKLLNDMTEAYESRDLKNFIDYDIRIHQYVWSHTDNQHLDRILNSLIGPISILVSNHATKFDWEKTKLLHDDLILWIKQGDVVATEKSMDEHMADSLERSLMCFHDQEKNESLLVSELSSILLGE